ncbi:hypothetical protein EP331_00210 [bacterium]|nr:MAG: hypothetical protein EP331_00210 [bacterium]
MKEVKVKNILGRTTATVLLYSSIKELPVYRYNEFEKLLMQDVGIGSSMEDVGTRFGRLYQFISDSDIINTHKEAKNLHNTLFWALNGFNTTYKSFRVLIHSVNGKEYDLKYLDKLDKVVQKISQGEVEEVLTEVKKKLIQNYERCFLTEIVTELQLISQSA